MLSTLVNTTWSLNNALTSYAGGTYAQKSYAVSITTSQPTEGLDGTREPTDAFDGIMVGYDGGIEFNLVRFHADGYYLMAYGNDTKTLPDTWVSVDSVSFTITGGTDATNSDLIAWLEDNATNLTPVPVVTYTTDSDELTSIADAIRAKGGTNESLVYPTGFVSAINNISTTGDVVFITKTVAKNVTLTVTLSQNATGVIFFGGASSTRRGIASYGTNASGNALCTELVDATDITITTNNTPSFTITNGGAANVFLLFIHYHGDEPTFP